MSKETNTIERLRITSKLWCFVGFLVLSLAFSGCSSEVDSQTHTVECTSINIAKVSDTIYFPPASYKGEVEVYKDVDSAIASLWERAVSLDESDPNPDTDYILEINCGDILQNNPNRRSATYSFSTGIGNNEVAPKLSETDTEMCNYGAGWLTLMQCVPAPSNP